MARWRFGYCRRLQRASKWLLERGGLLTLAVLVVYILLTPPYVVDPDNAELSTLGTVGGVPHPSGYPLYILWLRMWSWLPLASHVQVAAIATAVLGALSVLALHAACRAWGASVAAATIAAAIYAGAPEVLRVHTEAEVFALNNLVVATVLWLAAAKGPLRGTWRVVMLALVAGLGMSDQLTCVLIAPVGVLGAVRGVRETTARKQTIALGIGALVLGLTPYLYLFVPADTDVSWKTIDSFSALVHHFLRSDYGGPGAFSPQGGELNPVANLTAFAKDLMRAWLWIPCVAAVVTLVARSVRPTRDDREPRAGWILLLVSFLLAGPLLVARFDIEPTGLNLYAARRFFVLPTLMLTPAVAAAFDLLKAYMRPREAIRARVATVGVAVIATLGFGAIAGRSLPELQRVHSPAYDHALRATLASLPPNAVVVIAQGAYHFGFGYLRVVERQRPDVTFVMRPQLPNPSYRARLARKGIHAQMNGDKLASVQIADDVLASGRPLYVDSLGTGILKEFPTVPYGLLFEVKPRGSQLPPIDEVAQTNFELFAKFDLEYPRPHSTDDFAAVVHNGYATTWRIIGRAFESAGNAAGAERAFALADKLAPVD